MASKPSPQIRLSAGQREVLGVLAGYNYASDGAPSTPEISRRLRKRFDDWARGKLVALEKRGFAVRLGTTFSNGQCWSITDAGRAALQADAPNPLIPPHASGAVLPQDQGEANG